VASAQNLTVRAVHAQGTGNHSFAGPCRKTTVYDYYAAGANGWGGTHAILFVPTKRQPGQRHSRGDWQYALCATRRRIQLWRGRHQCMSPMAVKWISSYHRTRPAWRGPWRGIADPLTLSNGISSFRVVTSASGHRAPRPSSPSSARTTPQRLLYGAAAESDAVGNISYGHIFEADKRQ